jgi:hypothetical protein
MGKTYSYLRFTLIFITPEFTLDVSSLAFLSGASRLRDGMMLMLASGSTNYSQKTSKIA